MTETFSIYMKRRGKMSSELLEWKEHLLLTYRDLDLTFRHRHYWSRTSTRKDCDVWSMTWDLAAVSNFVSDLSKIVQTKVKDYKMSWRSNVTVRSDNSEMPFYGDYVFKRDWHKEFLKSLHERYDSVQELEELLRVWTKKHYDIDNPVFNWNTNFEDIVVEVEDKDNGNALSIVVNDLSGGFTVMHHVYGDGDKQPNRKIHSKKLRKALIEYFQFRWDGEL